jgi:hypothetical protein
MSIENVSLSSNNLILRELNCSNIKESNKYLSEEIEKLRNCFLEKIEKKEKEFELIFSNKMKEREVEFNCLREKMCVIEEENKNLRKEIEISEKKSINNINKLKIDFFSLEKENENLRNKIKVLEEKPRNSISRLKEDSFYLEEHEDVFCQFYDSFNRYFSRMLFRYEGIDAKLQPKLHLIDDIEESVKEVAKGYVILATPIAGPALAPLINWIPNYEEQKEKRIASRVMRCFKPGLEKKDIVTYVSAELTIKYIEQLRCLTEKGAKRMAESAASRAIFYMQKKKGGFYTHANENPDMHIFKSERIFAKLLEKGISELLLGKQFQSKCKKIRRLKLLNSKLDKNWNGINVFEKTGIRKETEVFYKVKASGKKITHDEKYGYRKEESLPCLRHHHEWKKDTQRRGPQSLIVL